MNAFLSWLDSRMATPTLFGWFHIVSILLVVGLSVLLCVKYKNSTDKQHRTILLIISIISIVFEIYKQINYSFNASSAVWRYQWYAFPFQFCSTPMYIAFIASFIKNKKVQSYFNAYLGTFALFAGLTVMAYPGDVFTSVIGINIQTMVCHGSMIVLGTYLLASGRCELKHKSILKALAVFGCLVAVALGLNLIWPTLNINQTFNMFFISPYYPCTLPVLNIFYPPVTPYPVFVLIYILGFTLAGYLMLLFAMLINKIVKVCKAKKLLKTQSAQTSISEKEKPNIIPQDNFEEKESK